MRDGVLREVAARITALVVQPFTRVAIDGVDGAGKTCIADELAHLLRAQGRSVIRASVDGFHNPRAVRYAQGALSATGFFLDSYDYASLARVLLDPLSSGGDGAFRTAIFDHTCDSFVDLPVQQAQAGAILLLDGIFLHRVQLRRYWDFSVFLRVEPAVAAGRLRKRDFNNVISDAAAQKIDRYHGGQQLYFDDSQPEQHATLIIDNTDLTNPQILAQRHAED